MVGFRCNRHHQRLPFSLTRTSIFGSFRFLVFRFILFHQICHTLLFPFLIQLIIAIVYALRRTVHFRISNDPSLRLVFKTINTHWIMVFNQQVTAFLTIKNIQQTLQ
ncbi:hypothetical protein HanHA300_Chr15g0578661 [Helianthus annuus]|nr:hypothetical protein HanHA300_Chr15g0578661 [Helianthus annuus]KAJ0474324.1 hypothetical protein HanHA89_Chr15g0628371 [Helianthus annuus]KAJ0649887.1 hypothetical protein HanLR1_Chr15g0589371 [Helianthus annuus]